jgi:hypothetical protein
MDSLKALDLHRPIREADIEPDKRSLASGQQQTCCQGIFVRIYGIKRHYCCFFATARHRKLFLPGGANCRVAKKEKESNFANISLTAFGGD